VIGGVTKFGGGSRDARALGAHLGKPQPGGSAFSAVNTAAADIDGVLAEARMMASSAGIGDRPFLHVHLSPSSALTFEQLVQAAEVVCRELGVTDQPVGVELHGKPRLGGAGDWHAHIVVGRAGASGAVLPSGFEKIRLETAVRVAEFEVGDDHVLGRHFASSIRHLEKTGRQDVVESMRAAFGPEPEKPTSAASPSKRQALDRKGVDLSVARVSIREAWQASDGPTAFRAALAAEGFAVAPGQKPGVWLVTAGDVEVGALDRLVKQKRADVAARMEEIQHVPAVEAAPAPAPETAVLVEVAPDGGDAPRPDERRGAGGPSDPHGRAAAAAAPRAPGRDAERRAEPDQRAEGPVGGGASEPTPFDDRGRRPANTDRRDRIRDRAALASLRRVPDARLTELATSLREVSRPLPDRVRDELDRRRDVALQRWQSEVRIPAPGPALTALRNEVAVADKKAGDAFYGNLPAVRFAEEKVAAPEPTGFWNRILGRHAEWRRERDGAQEFLSSMRREHSDAADEAQRLRRHLVPLDRRYGDEVREAEDRHRADQRQAQHELETIDRAREILDEDPRLARFGADRIFAEAQRRLDEEHRERMRRAEPESAPAASYGPRL
jgi:hypothetical protein